LISFKPGAFAPGVPVQPVCLRYPYRHCNLAWTEEISGGNIAVRFGKMMLQFVNWVEIDYLPVYIPSKEEKEDSILYANNVRNLMAKHMNVRLTNHSYDDVRLIILAQKLNKTKGVEMTSGIIFNELHRLYNMNVDQAQELLKKFSAMDSNHTNQMSYAQFCSFLQLPDSDELHDVFDQFDGQSNGYIDFKELLVGTLSLASQKNHEQTIKDTFALFDLDKNGTIEWAEFKSVMKGLYPQMSAGDVEKNWKEMSSKSEGSITYEEFAAFGKKNPIQIKTAYDRLRQQPPPEALIIDVSLEDST